jgi:phage protein D
VFTNQTIIDVARTIAKENKLSLSSDSGAYLAKYEQVTVSNESYWEWLVRRAKSMGYGLRITGTTLEFKPLQSFIDNTSTDVPILQQWGERAPTETNALAPTLDTFKVFNGDFIESGDSRRSTKFVGGIDPRTGKEFFSDATPLKETGALRATPSDVLFAQSVTDIVSSNKDMAKSKAEGAALLSRFSIPARATAQGDPRMRPFSLVYVDGTGDESDGYWMIEEVTHVMELYGTYHVDLKLLSDGAGISKETIVRPATASLSGTVNLNEVILSGRTKISTTPKETASLENRGQILAVGNQGFARTPSRWVSNTKEIM